mgnify:CR=1 FL=1|jgi:hypothetical protein
MYHYLIFYQSIVYMKYILLSLLLLLFYKSFILEKFNQNIVYYQGSKYDITEFINKHPGGSVISKSIGKNLDEVWDKNNVSWHKNNLNVKKVLEKYKIE